MKEHYKVVLKPSYIDEKSAIAIADSNIGLKLSIYREALKKNLYYGFLGFSEFEVSLVFYKKRLFWKVKITKGEWGATNFKRIPLTNKTIDLLHSDGYFDEESNIWCLISVEDGDYIYGNEINACEVKNASKKDLSDLFKEREKQLKIYNRNKNKEEIEW